MPTMTPASPVERGRDGEQIDSHAIDGSATDTGAIDAGVIEEARDRQHRRHRLALATAGLLVVALALALARGGGGGGGRPAAGGAPAPGAPLRLTFRAGRPYVDGLPYELAVSPSLQAGNDGLCVAGQGHGTSCGGSYPGPGRPVSGAEGVSPELKVQAAGEVDFTLTGPGVAAVRVRDLGTFKTLALPGLPPGDRAAVFYRPPGSLGTLLPPGMSPKTLGRVWVGVPHGGSARLALPRVLTQTLLDRAGHTIAVHSADASFQLPSSYWQAPARAPADGRCALSSRLSGVRDQWGLVATRIAADRTVPGSAFLSCLQAWYTQGSNAFQASGAVERAGAGPRACATLGRDPRAWLPRRRADQSRRVPAAAVEQSACRQRGRSGAPRTRTSSRASGGAQHRAARRRLALDRARSGERRAPRRRRLATSAGRCEPRAAHRIPRLTAHHPGRPLPRQRPAGTLGPGDGAVVKPHSREGTYLKCTSARRPPSACGSTLSVAPCAVAIAATIDSPRP